MKIFLKGQIIQKSSLTNSSTSNHYKGISYSFGITTWHPVQWAIYKDQGRPTHPGHKMSVPEKVSAEATTSTAPETAAEVEVHTSKNTLFVRNLPFDCQNEQLETFFSEFGPLRGCFVVRNPQDPAKSKGIGFVHFAMREDAERVMKEIGEGKVKLSGRALAADWAQRRSDQQPLTVAKVKKTATEAGPNDTQLVPAEKLGNVSQLVARFDVDVRGGLLNAVRARWRRYAPIASITGDFEGDSKLALMTFKVNKDLLKVYRRLHGHLSENIFVSTEEGSERKMPEIKLMGIRPVLPEPIKAFRLIIRNLPFNICRPTQLQEYLNPHGNVLDVTIPTVENERSFRGERDAIRGRGFAFVQYSTRAEAQTAMDALNGSIIKSRPVAVDWSLPKNLYDSASVAAEPTESAETTETSEQDENLSFSIDTKPSTEIDIEGESEIDIEGEGESDESDSEFDGEVDNDAIVMDHEDEEESTAAETQSKSTVFIRNLSFNTEEDDLEEFLLERVPEASIEYCKIVRHPDTGASRGTAFVKFTRDSMAADCIRIASQVDATASVNAAGSVDDGKLYELVEKRTKRGFQSVISDPDAMLPGQQGLILDGRILNCSLAVAREEAADLGRRRALEKISALLSEEGRDRILDVLFTVPLANITRETPYDSSFGTAVNIPRLKRNLALINESLPVDPQNTLSSKELRAREAVIQNRAKSSSNNANLIVSPYRLAVHHLPPRVTDAQLKEVMYAGVREARQQALQPNNPYNLTPAQLKLLKQFETTSKVVAGLHQVKIIAHRQKKGGEPVTGVKSRGYGFVQWRHPLMALLCVRYFRQPHVWATTEISKLIQSRARALAKEFPNDPDSQMTTPIVEFATEKLNVLKQRKAGANNKRTKYDVKPSRSSDKRSDKHSKSEKSQTRSDKHSKNEKSQKRSDKRN